MSVRAMDVWMRAHREVLHEPTAKRVRVAHGGRPIADSGRAVLVWEPRRIVPSYAVPLDDVVAELLPDDGAPRPDDGRPVLTPGTPFAVHTTPGTSLTVRTADGDRPSAAFRPDDPDLAGYVVLDFFSFDQWSEEDELIVGHPRDPFKRIDTRRSRRHVRVELDGHVLAESTRPVLLFETGLPMRCYLPRDDVRTELLRPSSMRSSCAYKGEATYWSVDLDGRVVGDVVWSYPAPLEDAVAIVDRLAFFDERVDVVVDGVRADRPTTEFSAPDWHDGTER